MLRIALTFMVLLSALSAAEAAEEAKQAAPAPDPIKDAEEQKYVVESVVIEGNKHTKTDYIKRKISIKQGEIVDEVQIEESRFRLLTTGWFQDVKVQLRKGSERGKVEAVFSVKERGTIMVDEVHIGVSDVSRFWAGVAVSETNLAGKGFVLSGGVVAGDGFLGLKAKFMDPDLAGTSMRLGGGLFYNDAREVTEDAKTGKLFTLVEYRRVGGNVLFGRRLESYFYIYGDYHFEGDEATFRDQTDPPILYMKKGRSYLSALTLSVMRDTRNDLWLPTGGWMFEIAIKLSSRILGSSYDYTKYTLGFEVLLPTFKGHSWKLKGFGGLIQGDAPFFEKFYLGDYFYFSYQKPTLPRVWEINVTGLIDYKTVAFSGGMEYAIPVFQGGAKVYRGYIYAAVLASYTTTVDELVKGQGKAGENFNPVSADIGFKMDTSVGVFTFSLAYWTNLLLLLR
jgi:outer membrane protein assembly factor BamA